MTATERQEYEVAKRRAEGTPCNKENFEAWKIQFENEIAQAKLEEDINDDIGRIVKKKSGEKEVDKSDRLTGFEQFSGKQDNLEALEAAAENAQEDENEEFEGVDEELFDDDVDLDDLDFDDDEEDCDDDYLDDDEELDI